MKFFFFFFLSVTLTTRVHLQALRNSYSLICVELYCEIIYFLVESLTSVLPCYSFTTSTLGLVQNFRPRSDDTLASFPLPPRIFIPFRQGEFKILNLPPELFKVALTERRPRVYESARRLRISILAVLSVID